MSPRQIFCPLFFSEFDMWKEISPYLKNAVIFFRHHFEKMIDSHNQPGSLLILSESDFYSQVNLHIHGLCTGPYELQII